MCCWGFWSSQMWHSFTGHIFHNILNNHTACIFTAMQTKMKLYSPSTYQKLYTPIRTAPHPRRSASLTNSSTIYRVIWSVWKTEFGFVKLSQRRRESSGSHSCVWPCHSSGDKMLASYCRGLRLNPGYSMWVVWWAEWLSGKISVCISVFSCPLLSHNILHWCTTRAGKTGPFETTVPKYTVPLHWWNKNYATSAELQGHDYECCVTEHL